MEPVVFKEEWDLGIGSIDAQHRDLVELINSLIRMRQMKDPREMVAEVLDELHDYVFTHFHDEEELMERAGYEDLENHRRLHAEFVQKLLTFNKSFRQGKANLDASILVFLSGWLVNHIRGEDPRYAAVVKEKGV